MPSRSKRPSPSAPRIGMGYDIHRFVPGRRLVLGGVRIPHRLGLEGHSDADVLLHAICDAMLGAASLGDIGKHFPDTDPAFLNISSLRLLRSVVRLVKEKGYLVGNIDATLLLEAPKIAPYRARMEAGIARASGLPATSVSVKATTNERLGALGRAEGCAAMAVVLLLPRT